MNTALDVRVDKLGFPLVWLPKSRFEIHWLPITKIQFEHYMVETGAHDTAWYQEKLTQYNGRIPPAAITVGNYWSVFMTGILPAEAVRLATWYGAGFQIPTAAEWHEALVELATLDGSPDFVRTVSKANGLKDRSRELIQRLDQVTQEDVAQLGNSKRLLCDQLLMRLGVMEFVYENAQRSTFGGWGKPNRRFFGTLQDPLRDKEYDRLGNRTTGARMKQYGVRLIRRRY